MSGGLIMRALRRRPDVAMWAGISAIAVAVLTVTEFLVKAVTVGPRPPLGHPEDLAVFMSDTRAGALGVVLIDTFLMAALIVFLGAFRQLITRLRGDLEWVADLTFGAGLVWVAITLVGDSLSAGAAIVTQDGLADPSAIQALVAGHVLIFGPVGAVMTAVVCASAGYLTIASGALPIWTGWVALAVAVPNLVSVGTTWNGTNDDRFGSVGGWGTAALAIFPWLVWVVIVGVVTLRARDRSARDLGPVVHGTASHG